MISIPTLALLGEKTVAYEEVQYLQVLETVSINMMGSRQTTAATLVKKFFGVHRKLLRDAILATPLCTAASIQERKVSGSSMR